MTVQKYMERVSSRPFNSIFRYNSHSKSLPLFTVLIKVFQNKVGDRAGGSKIKAGSKKKYGPCRLKDNKIDWQVPCGCIIIFKVHLLEKGHSSVICEIFFNFRQLENKTSAS